MQGRLPGIIELGMFHVWKSCVSQSLFFVIGSRGVCLCLHIWEVAFVSSAWTAASSRIQSPGLVGSKVFILCNPASKNFCAWLLLFMYLCIDYVAGLLYVYTAYIHMESKKTIKVD